jgi:hypothetical protein
MKPAANIKPSGPHEPFPWESCQTVVSAQIREPNELGPPHDS